MKLVNYQGNGARECLAEYWYFGDLQRADHFLARLWYLGFKIVPITEEQPKQEREQSDAA